MVVLILDYGMIPSRLFMVVTIAEINKNFCNTLVYMKTASSSFYPEGLSAY